MDRVIGRFYAATFLYTLAHGIGVPLIPPFLHLEYGSTVRFIGLVIGLYGLMQIVLRLPMGDMADRRGRKPSIILALLFTAVSALFFAFAQNQWWAVPGVLFFGFAGGIFWVAANSYLFDRIPQANLARATSDYTVAIGLAFLIGPPLGHIIAENFGFRAAFLTYLATSILALAIVMTLPEVPPTPRPKPTTSSYRRAWILFRHPALRYSAAGTFVYMMLFTTFSAFFELHVLAIGLSVTVAGLLLGGRQASAIIIRIGLPRLLDRIGPVRVLIVGIVVAAVGTALVPFATSLVPLILVVTVAGAATGMLIPANLMLVHRGAPAGERGLANGIYGTMLGIGSTVGPIAFGLLERWGLAWSFYGAGLVAFILAFAMATQRGRVDDQTAYGAST